MSTNTVEGFQRKTRVKTKKNVMCNFKFLFSTKANSSLKIRF